MSISPNYNSFSRIVTNTVIVFAIVMLVDLIDYRFISRTGFPVAPAMGVQLALNLLFALTYGLLYDRISRFWRQGAKHPWIGGPAEKGDAGRLTWQKLANGLIFNAILLGLLHGAGLLDLFPDGLGGEIVPYNIVFTTIVAGFALEAGGKTGSDGDEDS